MDVKQTTRAGLPDDGGLEYRHILWVSGNMYFLTTLSIYLDSKDV